MRYTTLFGLGLELDASPDILAFHAALAGAPSGRAAEDLLYSTENPLHNPKLVRKGLPVWTADTLRSPEWAYLADAVARLRASLGELDTSAVEVAATLSVRDAALALGVSEQAVCLAIERGELPAVKVRSVHYLDPKAVDAYVTRRATPGRTDRVPALYACTGSAERGANLVVAVKGREGRLSPGDFHGAVNGANLIIWPDWAEAVVLWGRGDAVRAIRLKPAHGRASEEISFEGLYMRGRWEAGPIEENRRRATEMYQAALRDWGGEGAPEAHG